MLSLVQLRPQQLALQVQQVILLQVQVLVRQVAVVDQVDLVGAVTNGIRE